MPDIAQQDMEADLRLFAASVQEIIVQLLRRRKRVFDFSSNRITVSLLHLTLLRICAR